MSIVDNARAHARRSSRVATLTLATLLGCTLGDGASDEPAQLASSQQQLAESTAPGTLRFVEVTAAGTGCPPDSWDTSISDDGQDFTTRFSAYETAVDPKLKKDQKDCALTLRLTSTTPVSFAVAAVYYSGYAYLEEGVVGVHRVRYDLNGNGAEAGKSKNELTGPYDDAFTLVDEITEGKRKWSPCSLSHTLVASTELRLKNGSPKRTGYLNLAAVDGSLELVLSLRSRACPPAKDPKPGKVR